MRITNSMLVSNFMNDLYTNMTKLSKLQSQMASGKKYAHISDDPIAVIFSQQARYKLAQLGHYRMNVNRAEEWLTEAEVGCMEINKMVVAAYEACIDARTTVKTNADRSNIAKYVGQLRDHILQSLNMTYGDKYVFAGYNTTGYSEGGKVTAPFTVDGDGNLCYNGLNLNDPEFLRIFNNPDANPPAGLTPAEEDAWNTAKDLFNSLRNDVMAFDLAIGTSMPVSVNGIELVFYGGSGSVNVPIKDEFGNPVFELISVPVMEVVYEDVTVPILDKDGFPILDISGNPQYETVRVPVLDAKGDPVMQQATDVLGDPIFRDALQVQTKTVEYNNIYNLVDAFYQVINTDFVRDDFPAGDMYDEAFNRMMIEMFGEDGDGYLSTFIGELQDAQQHTLAWTADIGGRSNRIEILQNRYDADYVNYTQMLSDAEDIDLAEIVMHYKMAESVYRAALASGASIIQPTLMDFLRR